MILVVSEILIIMILTKKVLYIYTYKIYVRY